MASEIDRLIQYLAKLPGLGPRSARRAALHLIQRRETLMSPLARAMADAAARIHACSICGNLDSVAPLTRPIFGSEGSLLTCRGARDGHDSSAGKPQLGRVDSPSRKQVAYLSGAQEDLSTRRGRRR